MRLLYLLRHAKSSWDDPGIDDFYRPLNKRGRRAASLLTDYFRTHEIHPTMVLCSPSTRTRQTLEFFLPALSDAQISFDQRLYEATRQTLLALINELPDNCQSVLLIGHNPGLQRLALHLIKADPTNTALQLLNDKLPTGGLVSLSTSTDRWGQLTARGCLLEGYVRPSELGGED
jgi:phosphohistidine phosphatase